MLAKESPLQGISLGTVATVAIRELPGLYTVDLRVAGTSMPEVAQALGMHLSMKPGSVSGGGEADILCLAPDWWLVVGLDQAEQKLVNPSGESIKSHKSQSHYSAVDVSGQRTTIELEGPKAREVLAHLWDQDLREKSFPIARVSQGLIAKAPVIVWHVAPDRYRIMVRSSFAVHVWSALVDAADGVRQ